MATINPIVAKMIMNFLYIYIYLYFHIEGIKTSVSYLIKYS